MIDKTNNTLDEGLVSSQLPKERKKILSTPIRFTFIIVVIGYLMRIQKWPGSFIIICIGLALTAVLYFIRFVKKPEKRSLDYIKLIVAIMACLTIMLLVFNLPYGKIALFVLFLSSVTWLIIEIIDRHEKGMNESNLLGISSPLGIIAFILTILGFVFKIMFWPLADLLLFTGLGITVLWYIFDLFFLNHVKKQNGPPDKSEHADN